MLKINANNVILIVKLALILLKIALHVNRMIKLKIFLDTICVSQSSFVFHLAELVLNMNQQNAQAVKETVF